MIKNGVVHVILVHKQQAMITLQDMAVLMVLMSPVSSVFHTEVTVSITQPWWLGGRALV